MTLDLSKLLLFGILCATLHWLIARAEITKPLWSRAPGPIDKLLRCSGCSGWWLGGIVYVCGLQPIARTSWWSVLVACLLGAFVTPVFEGLLLWGLESTAVHAEEPGPDEPDVSWLDEEAAHGMAHEIAEELWGEAADEEQIGKLTTAIMHAMGPPDAIGTGGKPH